MTFVFQDGKSDYFQGAALSIVYVVTVAMVYFIPESITALSVNE